MNDSSEQTTNQHWLDDPSLNELPAWVKPGKSFSYFRTKYHIRGIVDGQAVMRRWRNSKQYWDYEVESPVWFHVNEKHIRRIRS